MSRGWGPPSDHMSLGSFAKRHVIAGYPSSAKLPTSMPSRWKGSSSTSIRRAAITEAVSRLSSGRHSLQPVAMSEATRVQRNRASIHLPQFATRSISSQPASFSSPQPLNCTGVRCCTALVFRTGGEQPIGRGAADREQLLPHLQIEGQVSADSEN